MSESPEADGPQAERSAKILPFRTRQPEGQGENLDPEELNEAELVDAFLAGYRHPSVATRSPEVIADRIRRALDPILSADDVQRLSPQELEWRQAYMKLSVESIDLTDEQWAAQEEEDPVLQVMSGIMLVSRARTQDLAEQHHALLGLIDFRLGVTGRHIDTNDEDWHRIVQLLFRERT